MIKKVKKKFIRITMTAVIIVFSVIMLSVNGIYTVKCVNDLNNQTQLIINSKGELHHRNGKGNGNGFGRNEKDFYNKKMSYLTNYFYAEFNHEKQLLTVNSDNDFLIDNNTTNDILEKVMQKNNETGWIGFMRYRISKTESGYETAVIDAENIIESILTILVITMVVCTVSILILFFIINYFSEKAVKPIAESYEKQKRFITDAGHELKTPLTAISANSEIIKMTYGENEWSDAIERQINKMKNLVIRLVQLSKMDEENQQFIYEQFSLSEAVLDAIGLFESVAKQKSIQIINKVNTGLELSGDENAIRQLISILMDNAVKYCDENGNITVELFKNQKVFGKNKIILSIKNDFANSSDFEPDKVFERFYRGNKAHTADGSFGLGLSIAQSIAEIHNLTIKADKSDNCVYFSVAFYE